MNNPDRVRPLPTDRPLGLREGHDHPPASRTETGSRRRLGGTGIEAPQNSRFDSRREAPTPSIVCGVDGSVQAQMVRRLASILAERLSLRLILVHAVPGRSRSPWRTAPAPGEATEVFGDETAERVVCRIETCLLYTSPSPRDRS